MDEIILASASPRRRELLRHAKIAHTVVVSPSQEIEPHTEHGMTPAELVWRNALRKARAVSRLHPHRCILAADTVVALGTRIFGKPHDMAEAASFLRELSGRTHEVLTAVILLTPKTWRPIGFVEMSKVTFRQLSPQQINRYISEVNVLDKAGAYAIQEKGDQIIESIRGSRTNVIGLPMERLQLLLKSRVVAMTAA